MQTLCRGNKTVVLSSAGVKTANPRVESLYRWQAIEVDPKNWTGE
jgi:hypothetical protein